MNYLGYALRKPQLFQLRSWWQIGVGFLVGTLLVSSFDLIDKLPWICQWKSLDVSSFKALAWNINPAFMYTLDFNFLEIIFRIKSHWFNFKNSRMGHYIHFSAWHFIHDQRCLKVYAKDFWFCCKFHQIFYKNWRWVMFLQESDEKEGEGESCLKVEITHKAAKISEWCRIHT